MRMCVFGVWVCVFVCVNLWSDARMWRPQGRQSGREDGCEVEKRKHRLGPPQGQPEIHVSFVAPDLSGCGFYALSRSFTHTHTHTHTPTHLPQELEKLQENPVKSGTVAGPAAASHQWMSQQISNNTCELQNACYLPSPLQISQVSPLGQP